MEPQTIMNKAYTFTFKEKTGSPRKLNDTWFLLYSTLAGSKAKAILSMQSIPGGPREVQDKFFFFHCCLFVFSVVGCWIYCLLYTTVVL